MNSLSFQNFVKRIVEIDYSDKFLDTSLVVDYYDFCVLIILILILILLIIS